MFEGLTTSMEPPLRRLDSRVQMDLAKTLGNSFKVRGNNH